MTVQDGQVNSRSEKVAGAPLPSTVTVHGNVVYDLGSTYPMSDVSEDLETLAASERLADGGPGCRVVKRDDPTRKPNRAKAGASIAGGAASPIEELAEAAGKVKGEEEIKAVLTALSNTPGLTESSIAPDVLAKLLPDKEVVVLPKLKKVGGGAIYRFVKRAFDVVSCSGALAVLAIPMAFVAVAIKVQDPGPAIYAQTRVGKDGKLFKVYKFRSMYVDAEARGAQWAAGDDPRVTPLGRKLRRSRLDEIPQFWNVVKGDMSLIGPRPERPVFHEAFCQRIDGWEQRLAVRPGITGLAQVEGGYELLPKEKAKLDIEYIENRSIAIDWSLIWRTLRTMVTGEGAR